MFQRATMKAIFYNKKDSSLFEVVLYVIFTSLPQSYLIHFSVSFTPHHTIHIQFYHKWCSFCGWRNSGYLQLILVWLFMRMVVTVVLDVGEGLMGVSALSTKMWQSLSLFDFFVFNNSLDCISFSYFLG